MNLKTSLRIQSNHFRANYQEPDIAKTLSNQIMPWFPLKAADYIAVFIGTDRSTGDALGPLAGTYFEEMRPRNLHVYGTIHEPVHAVNPKESLLSIYKNHEKPYLIAIDACLGKSSSVGSIIAENKPLKPGLALNKQLPPGWQYEHYRGCQCQRIYGTNRFTKYPPVTRHGYGFGSSRHTQTGGQTINLFPAYKYS